MLLVALVFRRQVFRMADQESGGAPEAATSLAQAVLAGNIATLVLRLLVLVKSQIVHHWYKQVSRQLSGVSRGCNRAVGNSPSRRLRPRNV